jgi:hypothetical protein
MDYGLPILSRLAGDPGVRPKDVIKAVSSAVADGKMQPSAAVATIADMPADPDELRLWLRGRYADALSATVHAKAALLRAGKPLVAPEGGGAEEAPGAGQAPVAPQQGAQQAPAAPVAPIAAPGAMAP